MMINLVLADQLLELVNVEYDFHAKSTEDSRKIHRQFADFVVHCFW
jgi:hypothetical protein